MSMSATVASERGATMVIVAAALIALFGFAALAVDGTGSIEWPGRSNHGRPVMFGGCGRTCRYEPGDRHGRGLHQEQLAGNVVSVGDSRR